MVVPIASSRRASASSSFGVVNMHLMSWPAWRIVTAWSMHVVLVRFEVLAPALLDQLDDPARIEIDAEADAAAVLGEVLDRQPQPPRPGRAEHQPVRALREELFRAACR